MKFSNLLDGSAFNIGTTGRDTRLLRTTVAPNGPNCRGVTLIVVCNLRFADDIDLLGSSDEELQQLTERLEKATADCGMKICSNKSKILVNSIKPRPIYG